MPASSRDRIAPVISSDEVRRIAALAKLELSPDELARMQRDLGRILDLVDQIKEIEDRETGRPQAAPTPLRDDATQPSLDHDGVAANAPAFLAAHFVVPRILGGES